MAGFFGEAGNFLGGLWDGLAGNITNNVSKGAQSGWDYGTNIADFGSGLAGYLTPQNVGMASKAFDAYNKYDMSKAYKKNMEQDMANQNALTQSTLAANKWNLQQAKDAEDDKDQYQANAILGFNRAFEGQ
jgi:hypothetical protein